MKILLKLLGVLGMTHAAYATIIYGIDPAKKNNFHQIRYPVYVQAGSFSNIHNAQRLKRQLSVNSDIPVLIRTSKGLFKVIIGPFYNQNALRRATNKLPNTQRTLSSKSKQHNHLLNSQGANLPPVKSKSPQLNDKFVSGKPLSGIKQKTPHPELSIFLGKSYIPNTIKGQTLQLLPYEIGEYADTFAHQSNADAFNWGIRAEYRINLHKTTQQNYFFDSLGTGIDFFQVSSFNQTGKVLQFNLPEFENYNYLLSLKNIRLMANLNLDFHPIGFNITPFIEGGIGSARTSVYYNSVAIPPVISPDFTLPTKTSWNFSYQAGAGIKYITNYHLAFSLRYLYANLGKASSSTIGNSTTLATPLTATLNAQNVLLGLTYLLD